MCPATSPQPMEITLPREIGTDPIIVNVFQVTFAGSEFEMVVGYLSPRTLREAEINFQRSSRTQKVVPETLHRLVMSPAAFAALKAQVDELAKLFEEKQRVNG